MSETIKDLPRELPNNELLGRQLFLKLVKLFPQIEVDGAEDHENIDWSGYTIRIPKKQIAMTSSPASVSVEISDVDETHLYVTFALKDQDYNNSTLPLDTKQVYDNLRAGIKNE